MAKDKKWLVLFTCMALKIKFTKLNISNNKSNCKKIDYHRRVNTLKMALTCHPHCGISNLLISLRFVLPMLQRIQNTKLSNTKEYNIRLLLSLMSVAQHPRILNCLVYSLVFFPASPCEGKEVSSSFYNVFITRKCNLTHRETSDDINGRYTHSFTKTTFRYIMIKFLLNYNTGFPHIKLY